MEERVRGEGVRHGSREKEVLDPFCLRPFFHLFFSN